MQVTFDYMPSQFVTFRLEFNHRAANVPYFAGEGGVTPPGGNTGAPGSIGRRLGARSAEVGEPRDVRDARQALTSGLS